MTDQPKPEPWLALHCSKCFTPLMPDAGIDLMHCPGCGLRHKKTPEWWDRMEEAYAPSRT